MGSASDLYRWTDLPSETARLISAPLADMLPSLVFVCSADGRQLYVNGRWLDYTGAESWSTFKSARGELLPTASLIPFRDPRAPTSMLLDGVVAPFRMRSAAGKLRWQLARMRRLADRSGIATAWVGIVEEAPASQAAASFAHALRTPLNSIRGWAHVLQRAGDLNAAQLRALDAIEHAVRQQVLLIEALSRREAAQSDASTSARSRRAMVVDSDPQAASLLSLTLRESALDPMLFADAGEAYEYLLEAEAAGRPRLLVVGAGADGAAYRLIRRVREAQLERGETAIRALALTDRSDPDREQHAREAGFDARLDKPVDSGQLRSTLRRLLQTAAPR